MVQWFVGQGCTHMAHGLGTGEALGHRALLTSELFAERKVEVRNSLW